MKKVFKASVLFIICTVLAFVSCDKEDNILINTAPEIKAQTFNFSEDLGPNNIIGKVIATDLEDDKLSYNIKTNSNNLFKIFDNGNLNLAAGMSLDYETAKKHTITIEVSDGKLTASAIITINVIDVDENVAPEIVAQGFDVDENIDTATEVANIVATDANNNTLTYTITQNAFQNGDTSLPMFEFMQSNSGELRLATNRFLDYENETSYIITVEVSDGLLTASADITINVTNVNEVPQIRDSSVINDAAEDIADTVVIGTIVSTDPEGDVITYSLSNNPNNLFEINTNGEISLAAGKSLDYETATSHNITIQVSDGSLSLTEDITINVTDVVEPTNNGFITTWKTTTANESITIPTNNSLTYNYTVNWGDGSTSTSQTANTTHTYVTAGIYEVKITGDFPAIYFNNTGDTDKIQTIKQWGDIKWKSMSGAFYGCTQLTYTATDAPDLSLVTDMSNTFKRARSFNANLNNWDVSTITNMFSMFNDAKSFIGHISSWDVSNVSNMAFMFTNAIVFNSDISTWDVSGSVNMTSMFLGASAFDQNLNNWDVSNVNNMSGMFRSATSFNGNISNWNVSRVRTMRYMFQNTAFNQDISNWDVSNVKVMEGLFAGAADFNQNISGWNVSNATTMQAMFNNAGSFSQDLSNWNTANVTSCNGFSANSALTAAQLPTTGNCF